MVEKNNYEEYVVGKCYPEHATGEDGLIFIMDDTGAFLIISFNRPSVDEIIDITKRSFEMRFVTIRGIMEVLCKFGDQNWMDMPFHPDFCENLTKLSEVEEGQGLGVTVMFFDTSDGKLLDLRLMAASTNFTRKFFKEVRELKESSSGLSKDDYIKRINMVTSAYDTKGLLKMSSVGFKIQKED